MTKKKKNVLFVIGIIVVFLASITVIMSCSKQTRKRASYPEFGYSYVEKINELKQFEWDIDVGVESPALRRSYIFRIPDWDATLKYKISNGQVTIHLTEDVLGHKSEESEGEAILEHEPGKLDMAEEAFIILNSSELEKAYLEGKSSSVVDKVIDCGKYRMAYVHNPDIKESDSSKGNKYLYHVPEGHIGIFFIYEISTQKIVYLAELNSSAAAFL